MKKVMIALIVAMATTISAFAQTTMQIDSVSVLGLNPMNQIRVHISFQNLSELAQIRIRHGVAPAYNDVSTNNITIQPGTDSMSYVLTNLIAGTDYNMQAIFMNPYYVAGQATAITNFTTSSCNFQASVVNNGNDTICQGQTVTLTASPAGANSYTWYRNGMSLFGETSQTLNVNQSGTYTVYVNDGCEANAQTTVTVVNLVATISANGPTTFCVGGSVDLTASSGASYEWNTGETTQTVTASVGDYYVTVTDANGCTATSDTTSVSSITSGATITAGGPLNFCQGESVTLYSSSQTGNTWSTGAETPSITVNHSDTVYVQVDNGGCTGQSPSVIVVMDSLPPAPVITASGSLSFCEGESVLLSTSGGSSYVWNTGETSSSISVNQTGNYTVSITDANGCESPSSSVTTVTVNPMPGAEISHVGPITFCEGGSVILSAMGAGTYSWNTGETTQAITASASGNYTVTVTNQHGCAASASQSVTVNPLPTPQVTATGSTTFCEGGSVTLNASGSGTHTWSTGHTGSSLTVSMEGIYNVSTVDANGCEGTSNDLMITVNSSPEVGIVQNGPNQSSIAANVFGGTAPYEYLWSTGATSSNITVFSNGEYQVTVTDANGCSGSNLTTVYGVGIEEVLDQIGTEIAYVRVMDLGGREIATLRNKYELMQLPFGVYVVTCHDRSGEILYSAKMAR